MGTGRWAGSLQQMLTRLPGPQEADGLRLGRPGKHLPWLAREAAELENGPGGRTHPASVLEEG